MSKIRVLFLAANPMGTSPLMLDEEIRAITHRTRLAEYRDLIEIVSGWAVRPDDLLLLLNQHQPHIVHFSGHGNEQGIILKADNGLSAIVRAEALRALFATLKDNIRVVILNSCYSKLQAESIAEVVDCVIGMNTTIGDKAAIVFASAFYQAIGFGRSVQEAFEQGITALLLENTHSEDEPELLLRKGVDPSSIRLIEVSDTLEIERVQELLRVADEILTTTNEILVENEVALIPFLKDPTNRPISRDAFLTLFEKQQHRGEFGKWLTFLEEQLWIENDPKISDVIDDLVSTVKHLYDSFYSYADDLRPFSKWNFLAGIDNPEISNEEIARIAREYLDSLRSAIEMIGICSGKLRSRFITLLTEK